jgi:hypothetical protein
MVGGATFLIARDAGVGGKRHEMADLRNGNGQTRQRTFSNGTGLRMFRRARRHRPILRPRSVRSGVSVVYRARIDNRSLAVAARKLFLSRAGDAHFIVKN